MSDEQPSSVAHHNVTVLTTRDARTMDAILGYAEIRALVWRRLDGTRAIVDSDRVRPLMRRLKEIGHAPRFSQHLTVE
jgi:hypothetical protein